MAILALLGVCGPAMARASLGAERASVEADRGDLGGEPRPATARTGYTVESFDLHGTMVREYVRPDGRVFAVAWEGLTQPDLGTLLGSYAREWRAARSAAPRGRTRARRRIEAPDVIVETWGHMRHLRGRAFDRALLPPGLTEDEID